MKWHKTKDKKPDSGKANEVLIWVVFSDQPGKGSFKVGRLAKNKRYWIINDQNIHFEAGKYWKKIKPPKL